jgi:hypothetical protein
LGLLTGSLTPRLQESLVRLSTWMPFSHASKEFTWFTGGKVHRETARTLTERAGTAALAVTEADNRAWEAGNHASAPSGPDTLVISVDGAFVPLVGSEWGEVKTLAVGDVTPLERPHPARPDQTSKTENLTYFSRMLPSSCFGEQALDELQRRGIETAGRVGLVVDGAEWIQGFIDLHYPEAERILDFAHAAEYVHTIGVITEQDATTMGQVRHDLKHQGATAVLPTLRQWVAAHPQDDATLQRALMYLEKRADQMDYPRFQAAGWPIGSGSVESANKIVVEARLKGSGMHWKSNNVNPLLALRNASCNDRWDEVWTKIEQHVCRQAAEQRRARRDRRMAANAVETTETTTESVAERPSTATGLVNAEPAQPDQTNTSKPKANHPWRRAWSIRRQREMANTA